MRHDRRPNQVYRIDIATGSIASHHQRPRRQTGAPSVLASGKDLPICVVTEPGSRLFPLTERWAPPVRTSRRIPRPGLRMAATLIYGRTAFSTPSSAPVKQWSRNPSFDLYATTALPAYARDRTGMRLAVSNVVPGGITSLMVIDGTQPARAILERKDLILGPQWSPDSKQIAVGVGLAAFTAFSRLRRWNQKAHRSRQWRSAGGDPQCRRHRLFT